MRTGRPQTGKWFIRWGTDLAPHLQYCADQDTAYDAMVAIMERDPKVPVGVGRVGRRTYWWRGSGGCGNEMRPANGFVEQRFCRFQPVDRHCDDCPNYKHKAPSPRKGVPLDGVLGTIDLFHDWSDHLRSTSMNNMQRELALYNIGFLRESIKFADGLDGKKKILWLERLEQIREACSLLRGYNHEPISNTTKE